MYVNTHVIQRCLFILNLLGLSIVLPVEADIKCWTTRDGIRECGNTVPAEYAQQSHKELDKHGIVIKQQAQAKTREEIEEEKRLAEIKKHEELKVKEQAHADRLLLDSFSSEDDILLTRDGRISTLEAQIQVTQSQAKKLQASFDQQISQAAAFERKGQQPPEEMVKTIESLRRQIDTAQKFIVFKRKEQETIRQQFETDLQRFRELTAKPPIHPAM
jgi:hypothetical protein